MLKFLFLSMFMSISLNYKNLFIILLSLELGVLGFFLVLTSNSPNKFILMIFIFVMSSILGLILFMMTTKKYSSVSSQSWFF